MKYVKDISLIKENSQKLEEDMTSGVYFLLKEDVVVYVGQSTNCAARVNVHVTSGIKDFDSYSIISIEDENERNDTEIANILKYVPKYNKTIPAALDGSKCFYTKKDIWLNRKEIGNRKVEAYIFLGHIFIPKTTLE